MTFTMFHLVAGPYNGMPKKVVGMYILLADDTEPGQVYCHYTSDSEYFEEIIFSFHSDNYDWEPKLHPYQQFGSNVLFFTFINPETMDVPVAFKKLGKVLQEITQVVFNDDLKLYYLLQIFYSDFRSVICGRH